MLLMSPHDQGIASAAGMDWVATCAVLHRASACCPGCPASRRGHLARQHTTRPYCFCHAALRQYDPAKDYEEPGSGQQPVWLGPPWLPGQLSAQPGSRGGQGRPGTLHCPGSCQPVVCQESMFLALSIHQAVSSGHSQLASEPQLNSMAAALWRECSRRGQSEELWVRLYTASQWLHACTGGQISLAASPTLQELLAKANICKKTTIVKLQTVQLQYALKSDRRQLVQALAAAGHDKVQQAVNSQDGTHCTQMLVQGPGRTRGVSVDESSNFLPDGSMSGVVAHVKLNQLTHFDAGVMMNKAVFSQLASDSERAAFMRDQVQASLPEAEAWRQLLQAEGGHCAGQAKSAGALPSQRSGQAPGRMPRTVRQERAAAIRWLRCWSGLVMPVLGWAVCCWPRLEREGRKQPVTRLGWVVVAARGQG
ncbi:hypothetical protein HaLaN_01202 [Haematococcus lacustris]|uniref:Uncharacterized protein n=1 Tax=Haematococcus lacustris TaxID=44745 RepID=A0A699Y905_HAELA|nr:hypothetical protein HaLaN_01202 [Haematococcus lacustris]